MFDSKVSAASYETLINTFFKNRNKVAYHFKEYSHNYNLAAMIKNCKTPKQIEALLNLVFDPKSNKFKLGTVNDVPKGNYELWTSSQAYLIRKQDSCFDYSSKQFRFMKELHNILE